MNNRLAVISLILCGLLGGMVSIFSKFALRELTPISITLLRFCGAFFILFTIAFVKKDLKINPIDLKKIFVSGLLFASNIFLFIIGLPQTTAIITQIMYLLVPVIVVLISFFWQNHKFSKNHILGVIFGTIGAGILFSKSFIDNLYFSPHGTFQGNMIIFLAVTSWAIYLIYSKKLDANYSPLFITTSNCLITVVIGLTLFMIFPQKIVLTNLSQLTILCLALLIILNTVVALFLIQYAKKHTSPFLASTPLYLGPLSASFFAIPFFGESLTPILIISSIFIIIGSYLILFSKKITVVTN